MEKYDTVTVSVFVDNKEDAPDTVTLLLQEKAQNFQSFWWKGTAAMFIRPEWLFGAEGSRMSNTTCTINAAFLSRLLRASLDDSVKMEWTRGDEYQGKRVTVENFIEEMAMSNTYHFKIGEVGITIQMFNREEEQRRQTERMVQEVNDVLVEEEN